MPNTTKKQNLTITLRDLVMAKAYKPNKKAISFPIEDISDAINHGAANGWVYKSVREEDSEKQGKEISEYFDRLITDHLLDLYRKTADHIRHTKEKLEDRLSFLNKKLDDYTHLSEDDRLQEKLPENYAEIIKKQASDTRMEITNLDRQLEEITASPSERNKGLEKEETQEEMQEEMQDEADDNSNGLDADIVANDLDAEASKEDMDNVGKEMTLKVLQEIAQKLDDLLVKVEGLITQINEVISYEYGDVLEETKAIDKSLDNAGISEEDITVIDEDSEKSIAINDEKSIEVKIEKETLKEVKEHEAIEAEAAKVEAEKDNKATQEKANELDEGLGEFDDLDFSKEPKEEKKSESKESKEEASKKKMPKKSRPQ